MVKMLKHSLGFTIIEVMLTLVIAGVMIIVGYRLYSTYRTDANILTIKSNIDRLAQAAALYYQANCYGSTDSSTNTFTPGTLYDTNNSTNAFARTHPLDITNDLLSTGYLSGLPISTPDVKSYSVSLVRNPITTVYGCADATCSSTYKKGNLIDWYVQVSVLLNDPSQNSTYSNFLGPNCTSSPRKGKNSSTFQDVVPCSDAGAYQSECQAYPLILKVLMGCPSSTSNSSFNNYLVFQRRPASPSMQPPGRMWIMKPYINSFTQQYRVKQDGSSPNQYFTCGS
jgi:prepilin-type N-terminal cleavage/methylation domain-containing protein